MTASDNLKFQFATDGEGNYGYLKADDSFVPFKKGFGGSNAIRKVHDTNASSKTLTYAVTEVGEYIVVSQGHIAEQKRCNSASASFSGSIAEEKTLLSLQNAYETLRGTSVIIKYFNITSGGTFTGKTTFSTDTGYGIGELFVIKL